MEPPSFPAAALQTVRAAPGSAASFCLPLPTGTPPFLYTWSRAGASLDDRFTTSDDAGGVRLTVSTARTGDSGVYTLQASNAAGSDTTKVRLEVSADEAPTGEDPPTFLRRLQDLTVKVGTRTRFLVEILSSTECKVTWYRNERRLMEAERVALARDGNFWCADVAAVSVDDAGRWTCTAENVGGRASCSAHLNVLVPKAYKRPEFVEELRALLTEQGTVSLECKVVGVPTPLLRWFKDSCEIKAGDVFALTANAEDPTSLGTYTCEAVNCMGRAYSSSKVHVVGHGSREGSAKPSSSGVIPEPPPIFTKELEDRAVKICEPIALNCQLVVPPWPRSVLWYNKEGKVEPGERYHVMEDGVGGYLMEVVSAEWQDEGEWKCVATSSGGRVGISTCFVTMDVPKNYRKPRFMENLQAVLTEEGLVSFECKVVGFPTPVLSWFKDGQELKPGDVYQLTGTNSLGSYCCIARNCMGQASSSAELTVEDIQNQLNEEEKLQLFSKNQAPKFIQGLKSVEVKIDEPFRFTIKVAIPPEPSVLWYRDDQPVDESNRCHHGKEERGVFYLDIQNLEFLDQAEWKCVAINDFGHSVTSCFLKLIIPRHYKKPRFLENLQAILSEEGAVNLECKVIGVPQPVLKWYKDGEELKPGDIHRIISGQDGTCCLGTYTCEAQNCMGIAASSASLLGFDDSMKAKKKKAEEQALQRNLSLSTIHEERTSQMYDTPVGDITEDKGEISFSFDGKEVSVSLYETPDLTEEEALQIVEMYADQLSENVTEHNVVELPPLRFVKETSTSGNLLMEAIIIDVSPEYFPSHEEDLRTEADVDDISIAEENGPPNSSLDQDIDIVGEDYLEKTMALLSEEKAYKFTRKKSDSQKSVDDYFSLSREHSLSEEKRDDDTHGISESDLQSFASAKSLEKPKSKSPKLPGEDGQESSEPTKTILIKDEVKIINEDSKSRKERRSSRSRRSSSESDKCQNRAKQDVGNNQEEVIKAVISNNEFIECEQNIHMIHNENVKALLDHVELKQEKNMDESTELAESIIMSKLKANEPQIICEEFKNSMLNMSKLITQVINDIEIIEKDIILKSELMSSAATASKSLEIISSLIAPLSEIISISDAAKESAEAKEVTSSLFNSLPQPLRALQRSLTIVEKCIDVESDNKTLVKKTCVAFIEKCGENIQKLISEIKSETSKNYLTLDSNIIKEIITVNNEIDTVIKLSTDTIRTKELLTEANKIKDETIEAKHLKETQKNVFYLKTAINSLLYIIKSADTDNIEVSSKVKVTDIILNNMSVAIHDLQTALEQIENLSVKESNLSLPNYNNEIINSVMDPVLKLRSSFEQLSTEVSYDDKPLLKETSKAIQINLNHVATHINRIENEIGKFDILESENKLDVLQKMAQILINLENNLPRLEIMPQVKISMIAFHKNLTRVLENVIESNDDKKYCELMEICDAINRVNTSIKCIDTDNILSLVSISNNLRIIQNKFNSDVFESKLNGSLLTTITDILIGIQETINKAEEVSMSYNSDHVQEIPCDVYDISKSNTVIEQINRTMASIDIVKSLDSASYFKKTFIPVLENISPILEELKTSIACATGSAAQDESVSDILSISFAETLANPLCELNQNIVILNQIIIENTESIKDNTEILSTFAKPLHELHKTLEILQQDIVSQYAENLTPYEVSANIASAVNNLQSCIVIVQEQAGVEGTDEMSTLEDISGIKTTAETIVSDRFVAPSAEVIVPELHVAEFEAAGPKTAAADALQMLNEHLSVLQNPEIIEALETLSEVSELSSLKSVIIGLGELHTGIEEILHPVVFDNSGDIFNLVNSSKLLAIAEPMQDIQQHLSVLDTNTISIYENVLKISPQKIGAMVEKIRVFQDHLYRCMQAIYPALETAENTIEISNKIGTLRVVCKHLKDVIESTNVKNSNSQGFMEMRGLVNAIDNLLEATDVCKGIRIEQIKYRTEELYEKITTVQEELIQFTPQSPNKLAEEVQLIEIIHEVEKNIAILEQYEFIELSRASDLTSCASSHVAMELETLSLMKIDDLAENAVHVIQDSVQETPLVDLLIVEDFFTTCKNEFSLLRCLASKYLTYKRIIRLLQEFNVLKNTVDEFKFKKMELNLSDNINACLTNFLDHADECINITITSLIKIIDEKSDMLFHTSFCKIDSTYDNFNKIIDDINDTDLKEVLVHFIEILNVAKPCIKSAKIDILDELKGARLPCRSTNSKLLADRVEAFVTLIENKIITSNIDTKLKLQNVLKCIQKYSGYRDAMGTSQVMILLKGLTECADVLQNKSLCVDFTEQVATPDKIGNELQTALNEMLEPLQFIRNQIKDIQKQTLSGIDEESISVDVTITKSLVDTMTQINQDIVDKIDALPLDSEDFSLASEVDIEIQSIQDSLKAVDNIEVVQSLKELLKPLEEVERTLQKVLTPQNIISENKESLTTENPKLLIQHIDQYIELIEVVEEISAVIKIENLKEVVEIAKELRESISVEGEIYRAEDIKSEITAHQFRLANNLQKALTTLQVQILDSAQELAPELYDEVLQRITKVTEQLQADLVVVTGVHIAIQAPFTLDKRLKNDALIKNTDITSDEISSVKFIDMKVEANEDESDKIATKKLIVEGQSLDNYLSENSEMEDTKTNNDLNEKNEEKQRTEKSLSTQSNESCKTNDETTVKMKSKELITETVMPSEEVSDSSKEIPIGKSSVILKANVSDVIRLEAREVASSTEVITEQTLDIQGEVVGAQVNDLRETKEKDTINVESNEVITAAMMPSEKTSELTEEVPIAKADVKSEASVEDVIKLEAKQVVSSTEVITEQTVDIEKEMVRAQATESCETRDEGTVKVESKEVITEYMMPCEKALELTEEVPIAKADVKLEASVEDMLKSVAKEVISSAEVITEQAVDIEGEVVRAQATESCETRAEGTVKVESKEVISEGVILSEKALELTEEVPIAKADVKSEANVEDVMKLEAKEVVSSAEVITEQAVDIEGEGVRAQATESCETKAEGTVKVESKEVITEAVMHSEKALELIENVPIPKADIMLEASVEDVIKLEAKEVVSTAEVITEQAVDIQGEVVRAQTTESCEARADGTVKVESKEVITEDVIVAEKVSEFVEEIPIGKANLIPEAGDEYVIKLVAKEVVSSAEIITEQTLDIEGKVVGVQAIESREIREEGTVKVETKEVIAEAVMLSEKVSESLEEIPIVKTDVITEAGVKDIIKLEVNEVMTSKVATTEETLDIEGEVIETQNSVSYGTREEGKARTESMKVNIDGISDYAGTGEQADVKSETNNKETFKSGATGVVSSEPVQKIVGTKDLGTTVKDVLITHKQDINVGPLTDFEVVQETETVVNVNIPKENVAVIEDSAPVLFEEIAINDKNELIPVKAGETVEGLMAKAVIDYGGIIQHIEDFVASDIVDIVDGISNLTHVDELKETVEEAKELRKCILASDILILEEAVPLNEMMAQQARLAEKLQYSLSLLHTKTLESSQELAPVIKSENLQRISEIITHLQDDLERVIVSAPIVVEEESTYLFKEQEEDALKQLDLLLKEVNTVIDVTDKNESESLKDTLNEVQTVIIKLKKEFDGAGDILNETLDDLECSVRSVQLQINEDMPQELLKEACATLKLFANNLHDTKNLNSTLEINKESSANILENCLNKTEISLKLLEKAAKIKVSDLGTLKNTVSCIKSLTESLKMLRESFTGDADILIDNGVEVIQSLNLLEDKLFSIERDINTETSLKVNVKDNIKTAITSVYSSISHMRSTISSIQKRYMFDNYGKPSQLILRSIKKLTSLANLDKEKNISCKKLSKSLRGLLNHFEDIKFYINLDKTARLPSDAAFTKVLLKELESNICEVTSQSITRDSKIVKTTLQCVEKNLKSIETQSTVEVKTKIPIFKEIAIHVFNMTESLEVGLESECSEIELNKETYIISTLAEKPTESDLKINIVPKISQTECTEEMLAVKTKDGTVKPTDASVLRTTSGSERINEFEPLNSVAVINKVDDKPQNIANAQNTRSVNNTDPENVIIVDKSIDSTAKTDTAIIALELDKDKQLDTVSHKHEASGLSTNITIALDNADIEKPSTSSGQENALNNFKEISLNEIQNYNKHESDLVDQHPKEEIEQHGVSRMTQSGQVSEHTNITVENVELSNSNKKNIEIEQILERENQTEEQIELESETNLKPETILIEKDLKSPHEKQKIVQMLDKDSDIDSQNKNEKDTNKDERMHVIVDETEKSLNLNQSEKKVKSSENIVIPKRLEKQQQKPTEQENISQNKEEEIEGKKIDVQKEKSNEKKGETKKKKVVKDKDKKKLEVVDKQELDDEKMKQKEVEIKKEQAETDILGKEMKNLKAEKVENIENKKLTDNKPKLDEETKLNKDKEDGLVRQFEKEEKSEEEGKIQKEKEVSDSNKVEETDLSKEIANKNKGKTETKKKKTAKDKENNLLKENEHKELEEVKLIQEEELKTVKGKALETASKKIETEQDGEAENKKNKKLIEKTESEFQKVKEEKAEVKQSQEQLTVEEVKIQKNNEINGKEKLEQEKIKEEENETTKENEAVKKRKSSKDNRKDEKSSKNNFGKINPKQTEEKDTKKEKEKYELQKLEADSEKQIMDRLETVENKAVKDENLKHKDEELKKEKENTENCRLEVERIKESKTQKEGNESETRKLEEKEQYKQEAMTNKDTQNIKKTKAFKDKEKKEQEESVNQNLEQNKLKQEKEAKIKTEKQKLKNKKSITQNKELEDDVAKLHVKIISQNKEDQMSEDKTYPKGNNLTTHEAKNTLAETESHKSKDNELQQEEESKLKKEKIKIDTTHSGEEQKKLTDEEAKTCIRQEETKRKMVEVLEEQLQQKDDKTNDYKVDINKQLIKEQEEADKKKVKNEKLNQEKETETRKEDVEVKELEVIKKTDDTEKVEEPVKSKLVENKLKLKETAKVNEGGDVKQTEEEKNKIKEEVIAQAKQGECNKIYQQEEDSKVTKEKEEANNEKILKSKEKKLRQETKKNTLEENKHKQEKQTIIKEDATETVKTEPENKRLEVKNLGQDEEAKLIKVIKDAAPYRVEQEKKQHENNDRLKDKKEKKPDKVNTREEGAKATKLKEMYNELQAENRFEIKQEISGDKNAELHTEGNIFDTGEHYIREYRYEPHKKDKRDVPRFVDHNYKDYSMDFAHPPGYREKTFDSSINTHDNLGLGKNASIHKVQTIILESQLRNSTSPYLEREESRKEREEWRSESRRSKASSEGRSMASEKRAVTRDLKRKPVFSTYLTDRTAVEGSRVKLTCSVLSSTDPSITWYKNGIIIDSQLKYRTKFIDGLITLEVLNAVPSDSAEYSCTVENENGSVSSSANLKVYPSFEASPIPPTFTRSIRDTYHLAENELVLECRIRGQPLPSITWLKDDKPIPTNERYQAYYLADGVCRLTIDRPTHEDSGKYTCKAENAAWSDHINHVVHFTGKESRLSPNLATTERTRFNRQAMESRRPHFTNVLSDYKVVKGGTIGLQVEIRGAPTHVEWLREGRSVTEIYRNARTFVEQGLYTLALSDVTEKESGLYTCRAWNNQENVDMNAAITVVPPNEKDGKPATIVGRPEKDILISVGEDINISFRMQGEPKPKVVFMKGIRDITTNQRVCKMTSDDYVKFTLKRSKISDAGTYCILVRNAYGCDRAFVTVVIRQRASSNNLISDWTYPRDDTALSITQRKYKTVPDRIPAEPTVVDGGSNWVSIAWPKPSYGASAPVLAYKVENWLMGKEGGARWVELGITPLNSFDAFNLKQGEEYHFRITPRNRYGFGESVQTSTPIGIGLAGDRPEFVDILPGQLKVLASETANLTCSVKGRPVPEVTWMKNGHEIEDDDRMKASFNGFNCCLTIDNINNEDEGRYSCEASNIHGSASTYARLTVVTDRLVWEADAKLKRERSAGVEGEYPPQFTMRLRDRRVQATYPVRLTCQVVGNPSPTVTWFKDSVEITLDSRHGTYQDEHFHTLEIAPTTVEDGGIYEVMARNTCGAVSCRCGLVVDKGIRAYIAPEFCCGLEPLYTLIEGEELRISVVVEAYPSVGVIWYRNGVRLRPSRRAVMTLDRDGQIELALASVTHRDAGVYSCVASNEVGRACTSGKVQVLGGETTAKRVLPVVISPDIPYSKEPMFIRKPRSSEAREGDTVIIACEVVGDPKPDVYWLRDFLKPDYYRDSSHFKRIGEGPEYRFEIPHAKLDYTGAYSVVARNIHGETKAIISLQIKARDPTCSEDHNIRYGRVDVIPRFDRNLTDLLSCDGDTVEFECRVSGDPEPDIRWFHYTELIRACSDFETSYEESAARLKIKHVMAEDEGTYTCEASNNLGKATSSACLVVYPPGEPNTLSQRLRRPPALLSAASTPHSTPRSTPARSVSRTPGPESRRVCSPSRTVAPTFYTYPYNKVVEEGENVVFKCAVKGMPLPWATWDKDGVIITPTSRITIREKDDMLRILEIEQVSIEDVGVYRITVENEFGRAEASARLEVITKSGKFYAGVRAYSASPRKSFPYRLRASTSKD